MDPIDLTVLDRMSVRLCARLIDQLITNGLLDMSEKMACEKLRRAVGADINLGERSSAIAFAASVLSEQGTGRTFPAELLRDFATFTTLIDSVRVTNPGWLYSAEGA